MKTAIVGLGNIGSALARNLVSGGEQVILGSRSIQQAEKMADELGVHATPMSVAEAVQEADVIILAIYFDAIKAFLKEHHQALSGKIIIDPSNPIGPDGNGGFKKTIPADQSSGELLKALVPADAELVKAFGTLTAPSLVSGANRKPDRAVLFYASDYPEASRVVVKLIKASGFDAVSVGGLDQSIRIEVGGDLHEVGKLGRLVSAKEAEKVL